LFGKRNTGGALASFSWDYENRNTLLVPSSGTPLTNLYDATGLRRFDGTDSYIWDQQNVLQVRTASTGAKYYQFTNSPGNWGGLVSAYEPSFGSSQFYAFDQSGNTRVATHKPGDVTSTVDYTAFGTEYYLTGGSNLPFRFGGRWGYYTPRVPIWILYIQQRWLDVALAQWVSRDLIGFKGGDWNVCRYVLNQPLSRNDPSGRSLIGAGVGCLVSGGLNGILDGLEGDSLCVTGCETLGGCIAGAVTGGLADVNPCVAAIIGSVINSVANTGCVAVCNHVSCSPPITAADIYCSIGAAIISSVSSCFLGEIDPSLNPLCQYNMRQLTTLIL
jgi:RHS repeat-associated protein